MFIIKEVGIAFHITHYTIEEGGFIMQITLTVPDTKADSFLDVLRHISYVEVQQSDILYDELSASEDEFDEDDDEEFYSEEFYEDLKGAIHELNEVLAGRKQALSAEEYLAKLREQDVQGRSVG
jgi:hypothetical protein